MSNKSTGSSFSLIAHGVGLIVIYSLYGVLQERIIRQGRYGPNQEKFESSSLLILCNRLFSISTGCAILFYKSRQQPANGPFTSRIRPKSALFAYAAVAVSNFLSTMCQYEALRYVSYTTQSLAKCSKMIPVLVVGALIYKKKHLAREWVAGAVIAVGCAMYLFSQPPRHSSKHIEAAEGDPAKNMLFGTFFLVGYLFFDGLVSTTQERVFGKNPSSSDPFGPESPVLDQMIWTNVFAGLLAGIVALTDVSGTLGTSIRLLFTSIPLVWDVCVFSAASATGLIILLNTIASFGALTSSLIMTIRQFLSILINAGAFGNFGLVGLDGWCGVGWVASGIYIKMNRKYDEPKNTKKPSSGQATGEETIPLTQKEGLDFIGGGDEPTLKPLPSKAGKGKQFLWQYVFPVAVPVLLMLALSPFTPSAPVDPETALLAADGGQSVRDRFDAAWKGIDDWRHPPTAEANNQALNEKAAPVNERLAANLIGEPIEDDPASPVLTSEEVDDLPTKEEEREAEEELEAALESEDVVLPDEEVEEESAGGLSGDEEDEVAESYAGVDEEADEER